VNIVCGILKEREIIGGFHGEDIRFRGLVYPRDQICVEVGKRAEEHLVFSILLLGEPKSLISQLEPSFAPLPGFALPLNIGAEYRGAGWHGRRK